MAKQASGLSEKKLIKLKYALTLKRLMEDNGAAKAVSSTSNKPVTSLGQLSSSTGLRVATLSAIFNGDSNPSALSIYNIIEALGYSFSEFAVHFDSIKEIDLINYYKDVETRRKEQTRKKK